MFNPKNVGICAFIGFALSFVIGLVSSNGVVHCLLNALIYAVVFGALCVGVTFVYQKFLSIENAESDSSEELHAQQPRGGRVDITIDDGDSLPEEEGDPKFVVNRTVEPPEQADRPPAEDEPEPPVQPAGENPSVRPLKDENVDTEAELDVLPEDPEDAAPQLSPSAAAPAAVSQESPASPAAGEQFVPVNLADTAQTVQKTVPAADDSAETELDELPDIGELSPDSNKDDSQSLISDSDFASAGTPPASPSSPSFPDGKPAAEQNAAVMAEAIRTVLAKE